MGPLLSKHKVEEHLQLYMAVTFDAINSVLVREEVGHQLPIYYVKQSTSRSKDPLS